MKRGSSFGAAMRSPKENLFSPTPVAWGPPPPSWIPGTHLKAAGRSEIQAGAENQLDGCSPRHGFLSPDLAGDKCDLHLEERRHSLSHAFVNDSAQKATKVIQAFLFPQPCLTIPILVHKSFLRSLRDSPESPWILLSADGSRWFPFSVPEGQGGGGQELSWLWDPQVPHTASSQHPPARPPRGLSAGDSPQLKRN